VFFLGFMNFKQIMKSCAVISLKRCRRRNLEVRGNRCFLGGTSVVEKSAVNSVQLLMLLVRCRMRVGYPEAKLIRSNLNQT
jgi:hypothetical protein